MAAKMIVTGDRAVDAMLRDLPLRAQKKLSRQATRKAAKEIVLAQALRNVPEDEGKLASTLAVRALKRSRSRVGHTVTTKPGQYDDDEQFPGAFLEFGTKERRHKSGKPVGAIQPRKFAYLRPAVYDNEAQIKQLYVDDMKQLINETKLPRK